MLHAMKTGNQNTISVHEADKAYPSGWRGHHQYNILRITKPVVTSAPMPKKSPPVVRRSVPNPSMAATLSWNAQSGFPR